MSYPQVVGKSAQDIWTWKETSRLTARFGGEDGVFLDHTKAGVWPDFDSTDDKGKPIKIEGNMWIVACVKGVWMTWTCEWLKDGQTHKRFARGDFAARGETPEVAGWHPRFQEPVGLMVSTPARDRRRTLNERSNVSWVLYGTSERVPCPIPWPGVPEPPVDPVEPHPDGRAGSARCARS